MKKDYTINLNSIISCPIAEELLTTEMDDEMAIMNVKQGKYFALDSIGTKIWKLIEEPRSVSDICDSMLEHFSVEREQCEQDVLTFLNELARENLIEVIDNEAG
jgi:hypothetical protein